MEGDKIVTLYLTNSEDNEKLQSYLDQYIKDDYDMNEVQNYLCIKLVPKEKSWKRLLDCLDAKPIMIDSDLRFKKRMLATIWISACLISQWLWITLVVSKDFMLSGFKGQHWRDGRRCGSISMLTSWAKRWRRDNAEPTLRQTLDKVYGNNIFSKTQDSYMNGLFYIPKSDGTSYHWSGQLGVQGLNQYTWIRTCNETFIIFLRYACLCNVWRWGLQSLLSNSSWSKPIRFKQFERRNNLTCVLWSWS